MMPKVKIIATGGTISGQGRSNLDYVNYGFEGQRLTVEQILARVPETAQFARCDGEQFENFGSSNLRPEHWLRLAQRINDVFRTEPDVAGVVVTHGTAILEETAYFLSLTVKSDKPVVVTGAMRPPSAIGTDADANLLAAVRVAASPDARGKGALVVLKEGLMSMVATGLWSCSLRRDTYSLLAAIALISF